MQLPTGPGEHARHGNVEGSLCGKASLPGLRSVSLQGFHWGHSTTGAGGGLEWQLKPVGWWLRTECGTGILRVARNQWGNHGREESQQVMVPQLWRVSGLPLRWHASGRMGMRKSRTERWNNWAEISATSPWRRSRACGLIPGKLIVFWNKSHPTTQYSSCLVSNYPHNNNNHIIENMAWTQKQNAINKNEHRDDTDIIMSRQWL